MIKNYIFKLIKFLYRNDLNKNKVFENQFKNKDAYIFGNGSSIKSFNLDLFKDKYSLSCGYLFLHKSFSKLNIVAHTEIDPFILYPISKNKFSNAYQRNYVYDLYSKFFPTDVPLISSLTNYYSPLKKKKIYFSHHFGCKNEDFDISKTSIADTNIFMNGSMYFLISLSYFMGFRKIYLVGMDYVTKFPKVGHFYEKGLGENIGIDKVKYEYDKKFFSFFKNYLDIVFIVDNLNSSLYGLKFFTYDDYFNTQSKYIENIELLNCESLQLLNKNAEQLDGYAKKVL